MNGGLKSIMIARLKDEQGVTIILFAILMVVFLSIAALAIDGSYLFVVHNELQNAADAGALAGARVLYNDDGTAVNPGANQIAYDAARKNKALAETGDIPVDVNWPNGANGVVDVQRGHWSFATHTFTPNASLVAVSLSGVTTEELDGDTDFINAIRVIARRQEEPAASYFARIFGYKNFKMSAEAIGYIGFAGTLEPNTVDEPIAICEQSLLSDGAYSCNWGRMINSGQNSNSETGGWTDFNQDDSPCTGGTNAPAVSNAICAEGNTTTIQLGKAMATNGGEIQTAFNKLIDCWQSKTGGVVPWTLRLPVVDCSGNNVGTCEKVVGYVVVDVVWITGAGTDPQYNDAPTQMGSWSNTDPNGQTRWNDFVNTFHLKDADGNAAPYEPSSIYFLPDCEPHIPQGTTGGENFGVLAKIPVLVK